MTDALYSYGETLGIAFQIIDDVLDLTGDQATVGKTLGLDLAKGKLTLPLIHAIASADDSQRQELLAVLKAQNDTALSEQAAAAGTQKVRAILEAGKSLEYARDKSVSLIEKAKSALIRHLDDTPARAYLISMSDSVLTRRR